MAFGFGFSKQKVLSAAEKFVQQGKLQNAIAEYEKIRKHDDKDLTVINTIGDLYSRLGDSEKAIECFKTVGDAYAAQGFTVKGIAMYKKITKLAPSVDGSLKLAELYTQQGLFNDARAQYLQVAEDFMKSGDLDQAIRLFQKVLEMDPENVPMRIKLAEVYIRRGKKKEAWEIFSAAAEALRSRGSLAAAEDILQRMLQLDPGNSYVLLMRGKGALESGDAKGAIEYLEKASDIDSHPEGLRDLLKAYLESGELGKAKPLAEKLLTVHNDCEGLFLLAEAAARFGHPGEALEIYTKHADRMLATDSTKLLANLHSLIAQVRDDAGALEIVMDLLKKSGESTHVNEVAELLAHASVKSGNLERAKELYAVLAKDEPQNALHMQNYQQVADRMTGTSPSAASSNSITAEEGALIVEELEATAPMVDQTYADDIAIAVRSAVTEADLFLSYNLPEKALAPLLGVLPQAPQDVRLNQRLAGLHTRAKRFAEAAVCCRTLETAYHDAGFPDEALRYGELATRYEQSALASAGKSAPQEVAAAAGAPAHSASMAAAWPTASAHAHETPFEVSAAPEFSMPEMDVHADVDADVHAERHSDLHAESQDLSSEWETLTVDESVADEAVAKTEDEISASVGGGTAEANEDASSNPEIAETVDEIKFYLEHFMADQARSALEKLQTLTRSAAVLDPLRAEMEKGSKPADEPEVEISEIEAADVENFEVEAAAPEAAEFAALPELTSHLEPADDAHSAHAYAESAGAEVEPANLIDAPEPVHAELETAAHAPAFAVEASDAAGQESIAEAVHGGELEHAVEPEHAVEMAHSSDAHAEVHDEVHADEIAHEPVHPAEPVPSAEPVHAGTHAEPDALTSLVADLEASIPDVFPTAPPVVAEPHDAKSVAAAAETKTAHEKFAGWPVAHPTPESDPHSGATAHASTAPVIEDAPAVASSAAAAASGTTFTGRPSRSSPTDAGAANVDLSEMFSELRHELEEEASAGDDDPETHYNMGVAFREMGLLDEAIAELQRVCTAIDRGHAFSQSIQTYTWLAQCFLDKGVPDAAIRWYEKALNIPGLDNESRLALHYELGAACEQAHNKPQALQHFTYVFGANIDYRDVAERIQALSS
ncbi:MAG: tetratricopeptide repeat protein [Terriglobales bacterium]